MLYKVIRERHFSSCLCCLYFLSSSSHQQCQPGKGCTEGCKFFCSLVVKNLCLHSCIIFIASYAKFHDKRGCFWSGTLWKLWNCPLYAYLTIFHIIYVDYTKVFLQQGVTWNLTIYRHVFSEICLLKEFGNDLIFMNILVSFLGKNYHTTQRSNPRPDIFNACQQSCFVEQD